MKPAALRAPARMAVIAATALVAAGWPHPARAVGTNVWTSEGTDEFMQGEPRGAVITAQGEIAPGPPVDTRARTGETFLWSILEGPGGALDLATGTHGRLFRLTPGGAIDTLRASAEEDEIFAMARASDGGIVFGVSPSGFLLHRARGGEIDTLAKFEDHYIWSILPRSSGDILVATGQPGRVWRVAPGGRAPEKLFESDEEHVLSLAVMPDGRILAGTADRGLVYEIPTKGPARILFDAQQKEIRAMVPLAAGGIAIAASGSPPMDAGDDGGDADSDNSGGVAGGGGAEAAGAAVAGGPASKSPPPAIYRLRADGTMERLWRCPEAVIFTMIGEPGGTLLVGTGNRGRVYRLAPDAPDVASLVASVGEPQVVSLLAGAKQSYAGTSNPAVLYTIAGAPAGGNFTSRVYDATQISRWGRLRYDLASGRGDGLRFESRSGNVSDPGSGWSDWSKVDLAGGGGTIESPPARYLQWRVHLGSSAEDRVARVRVAYLPPNLAPRITRLSVSPDDAAGGPAPAAQGPPALHQTLPSGLEVEYSVRQTPGNSAGDPPPWTLLYRTADWEIANPDQDPLSSQLYYRAEDDQSWQLLADSVDGAAYTWNTSSFPDGLYRLKLVVSDSIANPPGSARTAERTSALFRVDHAVPEITRLEFRSDGNRLLIETAGRDAGGIARAGFAIDGQDWTDLTPDDGLFDGNEESFHRHIDGKPSGEHVVVVRMLDETGNESVRRATLKR